MGTQEHQGRGEHAILHSSIALLQERFRQLQKVKEMRQERELLMAFSSMDSVGSRGTSILHLEQHQTSCFIHPGLIHPNPTTRPHDAVHSKAARPVLSAGEHQEFQRVAADVAGYGSAPSLGMGLMPNWTVATNAPVNSAEKDVDTSLHL